MKIGVYAKIKYEYMYTFLKKVKVDICFCISITCNHICKESKGKHDKVLLRKKIYFKISNTQKINK